MSIEPETLEEKLERLSEGIPKNVRELRETIHRHLRIAMNKVDEMVDMFQKQMLVDDLEDEAEK